AIIAVGDRDFLGRERGNPADDFFVGTAFSEIRHQVLHRNAARRKLQAPAAIDDFNSFRRHTISSRASPRVLPKEGGTDSIILHDLHGSFPAAHRNSLSLPKASAKAPGTLADTS